MVLRDNPLEDIRASAALDYVMTPKIGESEVEHQAVLAYFGAVGEAAGHHEPPHRALKRAKR